MGSTPRGEHSGEEQRGWQGPHCREVWDRPPAKVGMGCLFLWGVGHFCFSPTTAQEAEGAQGDQDPALPLTAPWGTWQRRTSSSSPPCPTWPPRSCASRPLPQGAPVRGTGLGDEGLGQGWGLRVWQPCPIPSPQLGDTAAPPLSAMCPCTRSWLGRCQTAA